MSLEVLYDMVMKFIKKKDQKGPCHLALLDPSLMSQRRKQNKKNRQKLLMK
jgi:hypothetical protein